MGLPLGTCVLVGRYTTDPWAADEPLACGSVEVDGGVESLSSRGRLGRRWMDDVPGGGNEQASALPPALHLSHGGASLCIQRCFAERHETQATGLRMLYMKERWSTS